MGLFDGVRSVKMTPIFSYRVSIIFSVNVFTKHKKYIVYRVGVLHAKRGGRLVNDH